MRYCRRCLYPENHPLGIIFDADGVCSGCRTHEEKYYIDWDKNKQNLHNICNYFRSESDMYDCIIPVSGARDSFFIVHTMKNVFNMHPLLVSYNQQYNTSLGINNLAKLRTLLGCDLMQLTVSPTSVKKITKETLNHLGSIYWHIIAGQTVFPVEIAVRFKIPLIVWGAHQGIDQVGMFSHSDEVEMTRKYRKEHDLMGYEAEDLLKISKTLSISDLRPYMYPHDEDIEKVGVRGIYLNNYLCWDSKAQHELMIKSYGFETSKQQRTFDTYNDLDNYHYSGLHDYIKFLKYGYGKVTDHACREIRLKRMTREEGLEQVIKYQNNDIWDLDLFLDWLNMSENEFFAIVDRHRKTNILIKDSSNKWKLSETSFRKCFGSGGEIDRVRLKKDEDCVFKVSEKSAGSKVNPGYLLIGKGWKNN